MEPVGKDVLPVVHLLECAVVTAGNGSELAKRTGISRRRLGYLLSGERRIKPAELFVIKQIIMGDL